MVTTRRELEEAIAAQERLRGVVPDEVIDATIEALQAQLAARFQGSRPHRERRFVTVLFADVSGYTAMSSGMDAEDVSDTFELLWSRIDRALTAHNGRIDKHIGDAVMAVWGGEVAREDDAEQAIRAALDVQAAIAELNPALGSSHDIAVRIGINTGPVLMGDVATTGEFTATGDTVNVAARLEQAALPGSILISHDTYRHVRGIFSVTEQPPLEVKGKDETLVTYEVVAAMPRPFRLEMRGVDGVEARMIGRDDELAQLKLAMESVFEGGSLKLVTIVGEAGIGKSRLLYEFEDWLRIQPRDVRLFQGRADQQRELVPYALVRDVFFNRFEISENDSAVDAVGRLEAACVAYLGEAGSERAHLIAHLVGFDMASSPHVGGILDDSRQLRDRGLAAVGEVVRAMTVGMPGVILLEDVHWADRASLEAVEQVMMACRDAPLAVVALARPLLFERRPDWGDVVLHGERIDLGPLPPDVTGHLVAEVLKMVHDLPDVVRDTIVAAADGNPFYVEELVKTLLETGAIVKGVASWVVEPGRLADLKVPETLTGVLQARLDRLEPEDRETLQRASVIGRVFWDVPVADAARVTGHAHSTNVGDVDRCLESLRGRELVFQHHDSAFVGTREFIFKHALLRDVTYESVLKKLRRMYHAAVARWLEAQPEAESRAGMIGHHFELAEEGAAAAGWFVRAGDQARRRYANEDALTYYRRALELGELEARDQLAVFDGLGEVSMLVARYDEAMDANRSMFDAAEEVGDVVAQARALTGVAFVLGRRGANRDALQTALRAEALLRDSPAATAADLVDALLGTGWLLVKTGDLSAALEHASEALRLARNGGERRGTARSLNLLSYTETALGDDQGALAHLEEAVAIDRERGDRRSEAGSLINLGEAVRARGDYAEAARHYRTALDIQRQLGDRDMEAVSLSNLGGAYVGLGEYADASTVLAEALGAFRDAGASEYVGETHRFLAETYLGLGNAAAALDSARLALASGTEAASPEQIGHAWRVLGRIAGALGTPVTPGVGDSQCDADQCFAAADGVFAEAQLDRDRALNLVDWARHGASSAPADADRRWSEARAILDHLGLEVLVAELDAERSPAPEAS